MGPRGGRLVIRVMPADQLGGPLAAEPSLSGPSTPAAADPLTWAVRRRYTSSGRAALDAVLAALELSPQDEVFITNSSGQLWVSPCVTSVVFNHAQPSRVLTAATRAILVIHEFGYPHPRIHDLVDEARSRAIPLIEDCAHSLDSTLDGVPLGSFGDAAVFSLPKVAPVKGGGILASAQARQTMSELSGLWPDGGDGSHEGEPVSASEIAYHDQLPNLRAYSTRRISNAEALQAAFPELALRMTPSSGVTPWYVAFSTPAAREVRRRSDAVEWGSTLDDDLLLVTTNPFAAPEELTGALSRALDQVVLAR